MPISRYPRHGHPLAPTALKTLLSVRIGPWLLGGGVTRAEQLCELDGQVWKELPPDVCQRLANEIVEVVRKGIANYAGPLLRATLPPVPQGMNLEDLELNKRTYNCLWTMQLDGQLAGPGDLARKTIGQMLGQPSFGAKCLVDLLTSIEGAMASAPPSAELAPSAVGESGPAPGAGARVFLERFRNFRLPRPPIGTEFGDLDLLSRTSNCLIRSGFADRLADLSELTLGQVLELPGFGMRCLMDYLDAMEKLRQADRSPPPQAGEPSLLPSPRVCLEDELREIVRQSCGKHATSRTARNIDVVMMRYGCDGRGGTTLQAVSDKFSLTRQRVLQICQSVAKRSRRARSLPPRLVAALELVDRGLPSTAEAVEKQLQQEGITRSVFRLEGLLRTCALLGQPPRFELASVQGRRMAAHLGEVGLTRRLVEHARVTVSQFGVTTVLEVAAAISHKMSEEVPPEVVARILESRRDFEWLDRESGWFWFRGLAVNRVVNRVRKILSVADWIDVGELRAGVARHRRMKGYTPPSNVLLELCRRLPNCVTEGSAVRAEPRTDWNQTLRGNEKRLVAILQEHGPVMQRLPLEERCLAAGVGRSAFYACLSYSPVIEKYAHGVYGIRGAKIDPAAVDALIPHYERKSRVRLDHGWAGDGRAWISFRISESMLGSGTFNVPLSLKPHLQGNYELRSADGAAVGAVVVKEQAGWGVSTLYRRRGGEPGDTLLLVFDPKARVVVAAIGEDSLVEPFLREEPESPDDPDADAPLG